MSSCAIVALWMALIAYWAFSAGFGKRRNGSRWLWWREVAVRLGFFAIVLFGLQAAAANRALPDARLYALEGGTLTHSVGVALCAGGIALAMLARAHLERSTDLAVTGPYALIRHPLYFGLMLAMAGSAIAQSLLWLLPLAVYGPLFILSAQREERLLLEQFGERYAAYRRRTKMLVPFVV